MHAIKLLLSLALLIATIISCSQRQTRVVINQGNPQTFVVSGHGLLDVFAVNGPDYQRGGLYSRVYWEIAPLQDYDVSRFSEYGPIVYGKVPLASGKLRPRLGSRRPLLMDGHIACS